ncbi:Histidine kinase superfamily protein [Desulfonema limicola]|uniref:histidine kinase n=1 Tax=Desulfonema limicola TaxID=45656 RepID=A0A975BDU8_9BACT|nr:GAF domain-containing sensor histidine kinase [Desulfonema limicola]QTA83526.1 Histidine kinase superfamily protein [Desulfonema limicola]
MESHNLNKDKYHNNISLEQQKIGHLNAVLNSIREVNRLIVTGKKREPLIKAFCESLVRNRGYHNAWIILIDEYNRVIASAEAGTGRDLNEILKKIETRDFTLCCRNILTHTKEFMVIQNPLEECVNCPVNHMHDGQGSMSARLEHDKKLYGMLTVSVPTVFSRDTEEHELFKDVADDIAFALHSIEVEEKRRQTEAALRETRDKLERRVKERTNELEMLSSKLLNAQEEERKRISGDLHDGIGQCLSAVKFMVETALENMKGKVPDSDLKPLHALVPLLREASEEVRTIVMNLRPSILDDLGILATIGWFCRQFKAVYSYIEVKENIEIEEDIIPDAIKTHIFRILQEAMNNIAKHSKANYVEIFLRKRNNRIELTVKDNGTGFNAQDIMAVKASEKGFGITGMKERTELSGGSFILVSRLNKGTKIRASWAFACMRTIL